jgi:hypothetical protein
MNKKRCRPNDDEETCSNKLRITKISQVGVWRILLIFVLLLRNDTVSCHVESPDMRALQAPWLIIQDRYLEILLAFLAGISRIQGSLTVSVLMTPRVWDPGE